MNNSKPFDRLQVKQMIDFLSEYPSTQIPSISIHIHCMFLCVNIYLCKGDDDYNCMIKFVLTSSSSLIEQKPIFGSDWLKDVKNDEDRLHTHDIRCKHEKKLGKERSCRRQYWIKARGVIRKEKEWRETWSREKRVTKTDQ